MKTPAPSVSPLLATISAARARMAPLKGVALACAAVHEMQKIVEAFDAYEEQRSLLATAETTDRVLDAVFGKQRGNA